MWRKSKIQLEQEQGRLDTQIQKVLTLMCDGQTVRNACNKVKISRSTFTDNVLKSSQYAREYELAKELCADCGFDELEDIADKVLSGELNPQAGRVAADIIKWRIARMRPNAYSERMDLISSDRSMSQASGDVAVDLTHLTADELMELTDKLFYNVIKNPRL